MGVRTCYLNCYHNYSFAYIAQGILYLGNPNSYAVLMQYVRFTSTHDIKGNSLQRINHSIIMRDTRYAVPAAAAGVQR